MHRVKIEFVQAKKHNNTKYDDSVSKILIKLTQNCMEKLKLQIGAYVLGGGDWFKW